MKRVFYILVLLCACANYASAQYDYLLDKSFAERVYALDSLVDAQPEHVGKLCKDILAFAKKHKNQALAQHAQLLYYNKQLSDSGSDASLKQFLTLLQQLKNSGEQYLYPYGLYIYATYLSHIQNNTASFEQQLRAYDIYKQYSIASYPIKMNAIRNLGAEYYRYHDFPNAIKLHKAIVIDSAYGNKYHYAAVNAIALSYRAMAVYDSAMYYFTQMLTNAQKKNNNAWILITQLNIGHTYYMRGDYDKAKEVFTNTYTLSKKKNVGHGICESATVLSKLALRAGDIPLAKQLINEAEYAYNHDTLWYYVKITDAKNVFKTYEAIYAQEGNYRLAYKYVDSQRMVTDSFSRVYNKTQASTAEKNLLLDKYEQEKLRLLLEKKQHAQMRNAIIIGIMLLSIISLLFINRQRIRSKQLVAEKEATEARLAASSQQLANYTHNLQEKNRLIEHFKEEIAQYENAANQEAQEKTILALQESTILTDEDWVNFKHMFEQVHIGFSHRLKEKMPDLTPGEIRFMVLSKLKLSNKEMANILGVGASTIRKYKHQVRHKLGLPEDGSIDEVIDLI